MDRFVISDDVLLFALSVSLILGFLVVFFLAWAIISFVNSHRRIAKALTDLSQKTKLQPEAKGHEKEWKLEESAPRDHRFS